MAKVFLLAGDMVDLIQAGFEFSLDKVFEGAASPALAVCGDFSFW